MGHIFNQLKNLQARPSIQGEKLAEVFTEVFKDYKHNINMRYGRIPEEDMVRLFGEEARYGEAYYIGRAIGGKGAWEEFNKALKKELSNC